MQAVPLAMYAPEVASSDPAVARVAVSSSYAHIVDVRCVGDGEAWLTAETMGKKAHVGVLVGSAKGQASMSRPRPAAPVITAQASTPQAPKPQSPTPTPTPTSEAPEPSVVPQSPSTSPEGENSGLPAESQYWLEERRRLHIDILEERFGTRTNREEEHVYVQS